MTEIISADVDLQQRFAINPIWLFHTHFSGLLTRIAQASQQPTHALFTFI